jgi:hypothetical protein
MREQVQPFLREHKSWARRPSPRRYHGNCPDSRGMCSKVPFGFHAMGVRLKTAPKSIVEIYVDPTRRDARINW